MIRQVAAIVYSAQEGYIDEQLPIPSAPSSPRDDSVSEKNDSVASLSFLSPRARRCWSPARANDTVLDESGSWAECLRLGPRARHRWSPARANDAVLGGVSTAWT
jgi:hypothetical protein